jgi:hypothetical protein
MLVTIVIVLVCVIGIIGAMASTLGYDGLYGQTERVELPRRSVRRKRLRRPSQQLRAVEAALAPAEPDPPPGCSSPRTHGRSRTH